MICRVAETTRLMTADELLMLREDGWQYELRRGELIRLDYASEGHGSLEVDLILLLGTHVRQHRLGRVYSGDTGFRLFSNPDTVREPDVAFVARARLATGSARDHFHVGAPDLAVEIASRSNSAPQLREKVEEYLQAGAGLVWVIYPTTRSVTVYRADGSVAELREGATLSGEEVVPGFACAVADLFAEPW
jgi:Uma2 family endonuclease